MTISELPVAPLEQNTPSDGMVGLRQGHPAWADNEGGLLAREERAHAVERHARGDPAYPEDPNSVPGIESEEVRIARLTANDPAEFRVGTLTVRRMARAVRQRELGGPPPVIPAPTGGCRMVRRMEARVPKVIYTSPEWVIRISCFRGKPDAGSNVPWRPRLNQRSQDMMTQYPIKPTQWEADVPFARDRVDFRTVRNVNMFGLSPWTRSPIAPWDARLLCGSLLRVYDEYSEVDNRRSRFQRLRERELRAATGLIAPHWAFEARLVNPRTSAYAYPVWPETLRSLEVPASMEVGTDVISHHFGVGMSAVRDGSRLVWRMAAVAFAQDACGELLTQASNQHRNPRLFRLSPALVAAVRQIGVEKICNNHRGRTRALRALLDGIESIDWRLLSTSCAAAADGRPPSISGDAVPWDPVHNRAIISARFFLDRIGPKAMPGELQRRALPSTGERVNALPPVPRRVVLAGQRPSDYKTSGFGARGAATIEEGSGSTSAGVASAQLSREGPVSFRSGGCPLPVQRRLVLEPDVPAAPKPEPSIPQTVWVSTEACRTRARRLGPHTWKMAFSVTGFTLPPHRDFVKGVLTWSLPLETAIKADRGGPVSRPGAMSGARSPTAHPISKEQTEIARANTLDVQMGIPDGGRSVLSTEAERECTKQSFSTVVDMQAVDVCAETLEQGLVELGVDPNQASETLIAQLMDLGRPEGGPSLRGGIVKPALGRSARR